MTNLIEQINCAIKQTDQRLKIGRKVIARNEKTIQQLKDKLR